MGASRGGGGGGGTVTVETRAGRITGSGPVRRGVGRGVGNQRVETARETNAALDRRLRRRSRGNRNATRK